MARWSCRYGASKAIVAPSSRAPFWNPTVARVVGPPIERYWYKMVPVGNRMTSKVKGPAPDSRRTFWNSTTILDPSVCVSTRELGPTNRSSQNAASRFSGAARLGSGCEQAPPDH